MLNLRRARRLVDTLSVCGALLGMAACRSVREDPRTVVVAIESSPNSLDPRVGTDAQSERIDGLIFDSLVRKNARFEMTPWLAKSWEQPDALTWIFHLRTDVRFQDGRALGADDVVWTINSLIDGTLVSAKSGAFGSVHKAYAKDAATVVVELKKPDQTLLFNLSDGRFGVVPKGSGASFARHPIGSGAFKFVSASEDTQVVLERMPGYWAETGPRDFKRIERLRFAVIPDAVTTALELRKGSVDVAVNAVTLDMVHVLSQTSGLAVETGPGSPVMYLNFNTASGPLRDPRVRQAIASAMDRQAMIDALWLGHARLAETLLPPGHWAGAALPDLHQWPHNPQVALRLLDAAGYRPGKDGVRVRLEMKTSTDETTRLLAVILQQQLKAAGIELTTRSAEFGTFYSDVTRGAFQMYALRWIGANEDPDIFRYAFGSSQTPPVGGNRGSYANPRVDALLDSAAATSDQPQRRAAYAEVQHILSEDLPAVPLWFPDNNIVHTRRVRGIVPEGSGSFDFLRTAKVED